MPFASFTYPRTNLWNFHKKYWELAILKNDLFLSRPFWFFFASFSWKQVKVYLLARMGQNFDVYSSFQPKITTPKHFSRQCTYIFFRSFVALSNIETYLCNTFDYVEVLRIEIIKIPCKLFINLGSVYSRNFFAFSTLLEMLENTFRNSGA